MKPTKAVLIVDDHAGVRSGLREWFRRQAPEFQVVEAASGEEAITLAADHRLDVVVMDVNLPGMCGLETTRHLKSIRPKLPVIILTLHDLQEYRNEAAAAGASAYLLKDLAPAELLSVLRELVPSSRKAAR